MCMSFSVLPPFRNTYTVANSRLTCTRPNTTPQPTVRKNESTGQQEAICKAVLAGKLGEFEGFTAVIDHVDKPSEQKDGGNSGNHSWIIRAVVAVVVITLLIITLWVLHGCYEKYSNVSDVNYQLGNSK